VKFASQIYTKKQPREVNLPHNHIHTHFGYFAVELLKQFSQMGVMLGKDCLLCLGALTLVFGPAFVKYFNRLRGCEEQNQRRYSYEDGRMKCGSVLQQKIKEKT